MPSGNSPVYKRLFGNIALVSDDLSELVNSYLAMSPSDRRERVKSAQDLMRSYTYEAAFIRILDQVS